MQSFEYFCRITTTDVKYMKRCLQLAQKGFGNVSPNPMVGCVIVHDDAIIGEGCHEQYGMAHAEVNAINSVSDPALLPGSTVYVSLEPCVHFGKTPPCADLLIDKKVARVVIGTLDPFAKVSGKGAEKLRGAGIIVETGMLEKECRALNKRFMTFHIKQRPYIILKWAESADGYIGGNEPVQISGVAAQRRLHQWRSEEDAFMVGTKTLLEDNPHLSTRLWKGKNPVRLAIDMHLKSDGKPLNFFNRSQRTIVLNGLKNETERDVEYVMIADSSPSSIAGKLHELGIQSVVIEGGAKLLGSFIDRNLFDEIRRFRSKTTYLHEGVPAPRIDFVPEKNENLVDDELLIYTK
jgi:diaminohydroxyphosphoribosylaminopyrimidine deaminase/5-amino-6-(5-phosphoribosylamino)uracil reductase